MDQLGIDPRGLALPRGTGFARGGSLLIYLFIFFENKAIGSRVSFRTPGLRQWNWDLPHLHDMPPVLLAQGHLQKPDLDLSLAPPAQRPGRNRSRIKS